MFHDSIAELAKKNNYFRKELFTAAHSQLVVMSIEAGDEIGDEVHKVDQLLFFVTGQAEAHIAGKSFIVSAGDCVVVPAGTEHNFINTGENPLKLYTIYAPAQHKPGTLHRTKQEADTHEEEGY